MRAGACMCNDRQTGRQAESVRVCMCVQMLVSVCGSGWGRRRGRGACVCMRVEEMKGWEGVVRVDSVCLNNLLSFSVRSGVPVGSQAFLFIFYLALSIALHPPPPMPPASITHPPTFFPFAAVSCELID